MFVEKAAEKGHSLLVAEAHKFTEKLGKTLSLKHPDPPCNSLKSSEVVIQGTKIKAHLMKAAIISYKKTSRQKSGTGICLLLDGKTYAPTHVTAGVIELYEHLTPTRAYTSYKTGNTRGGGGEKRKEKLQRPSHMFYRGVPPKLNQAIQTDIKRR